VYLGSIDAACNLEGLEKKHIGFVLSLLHANDGKLNVGATRKHLQIAMEDNNEEQLLRKLPYLIDCINVYLRTEQDNILVHWCVLFDE